MGRGRTLPAAVHGDDEGQTDAGAVGDEEAPQPLPGVLEGEEVHVPRPPEPVEHVGQEAALVVLAVVDEDVHLWAEARAGVK